VLSPLQERVAEIIAGLDEASDFALAGGGAMIVPVISSARLAISTSSD
jgi:hypothetical protein